MVSTLTPEACAKAVVEGRRAIFIDDGGTGRHTLPSALLVQDFQLIVAIVLDTEACSRLDALHDEWLRLARADAPGVAELHTTDLVNPKNAKSPWSGVSEKRRTYHLQHAYESLPETIETIHYGYIGGQQYQELLRRARESHPEEALHAHYSDQKRGLARNFYKALAERIIEAGHEVVVFHDAGFHPAWTQEIIFTEDTPVWKQSIIHVPSHAVAGVQVADLVAWTINRKFIARTRQVLRHFDVLALSALTSWETKLKSAW